MKKTALLLIITTLFAFSACGAKEQAGVSSASETSEETVEKTSDETTDEESNQTVESEDITEGTAESEESPVIECTEEIKNADFSDGIIQIGDMILPIDGTLTVGEMVKILENSKMDLEYDIPLEGMVLDSEKYAVKYNDDVLMEIKAEKISDEKFDTTKDAEAWITKEFSKEMAWLPYGICMTEGMTRDDLISILEEHGYSSDGSTSKKYTDNGDHINVPFPCKNISLGGWCILRYQTVTFAEPNGRSAFASGRRQHTYP